MLIFLIGQTLAQIGEDNYIDHNQNNFYILFCFLFGHRLHLHVVWEVERKRDRGGGEKSNYNGNWWKTFFCISDDCPKTFFSMLSLQFFVVVVGLLTFFFLPIVFCVKAKVNFHLIGHIISVFRNLLFFSLLFLFCWPCSFMPNWIHLHLLKFPIFVFLWKNKQMKKNRSLHLTYEQKIFVPCHVSLIQPWMNWVKSVNMNFIFFSNKQKNFR